LLGAFWAVGAEPEETGVETGNEEAAEAEAEAEAVGNEEERERRCGCCCC